jgi:hypothetical protein
MCTYRIFLLGVADTMTSQNIDFPPGTYCILYFGWNIFRHKPFEVPRHRLEDNIKMDLKVEEYKLESCGFYRVLTMVYSIQELLGFLISSAVRCLESRNTTFRKLDLFRSPGEGGR